MLASVGGLMRPAVGIMLLRSLALAGGAHKAILLALLPVVQVVKKDLLAGLDVPISVQPDVVVAPHLIQGEMRWYGPMGGLVGVQPSAGFNAHGHDAGDRVCVIRVVGKARAIAFGPRIDDLLRIDVRVRFGR